MPNVFIILVFWLITDSTLFLCSLNTSNCGNVSIVGV